MQSVEQTDSLILIPLMMISPADGLISLINIRNVVVFPAPFAPEREKQYHLHSEGENDIPSKPKQALCCTWKFR